MYISFPFPFSICLCIFKLFPSSDLKYTYIYIYIYRERERERERGNLGLVGIKYRVAIFGLFSINNSSDEHGAETSSASAAGCLTLFYSC